MTCVVTLVTMIISDLLIYRNCLQILFSDKKEFAFHYCKSVKFQIMDGVKDSPILAFHSPWFFGELLEAVKNAPTYHVILEVLLVALVLRLWFYSRYVEQKLDLVATKFLFRVFKFQTMTKNLNELELFCIVTSDHILEKSRITINFLVWPILYSCSSVSRQILY